MSKLIAQHCVLVEQAQGGAAIRADNLVILL